jgi:capsular exopolysaccharide synthesis family protein
MGDADRGGIHHVLVRHKAVAIAVAALVLIGSSLFAAVQRPVYQATASVALLPGSALNDTLGAYDVLITRLLPLYATKVRSNSFLDRVAKRDPSALLGGRLASEVIAEPDPAAAVLRLVVRDQDPRRAAALARAALDQFLSETEDTEMVNLEVLELPTVPRSPVFPRRELILGASLLLALFLAVGAAVVWDRLFRRIHELRELRLPGGPRVLGALPAVRRLRRSPSSLFVGDPRVAAAERSLRGIRTILTRPGRPIPTMMAVTGLRPGDGSSTMAANLAVVIAELGLRVLIVDADTTRPRQHEIFALPNDRGLSSVVEGADDVAEALQPTAFPRVSVLTAGPPLRRRNETVEMYLHGIPRLRKHADLVVVDAPALSVDPDVGLLAALTDGVVLLVRAGSATTRQLQLALDGLEAVEVPVLGLVLTMSARRAASYEAYGSDMHRASARWPSGAEAVPDRGGVAWDERVRGSEPSPRPAWTPSSDPPATESAPPDDHAAASGAAPTPRAGHPSSLISDLRGATRPERGLPERPRKPGTA